MKKPQRWEVQVTNRHGTTYWQRLPANKKPQMDTGKLYRVAGSNLLSGSNTLGVNAEEKIKSIGARAKERIDGFGPTTLAQAAYAALPLTNGVSAEEKKAVLAPTRPTWARLKFVETTDKTAQEIYDSLPEDKSALTDDLTIRGNINKLLDVLRCLRESDMLSADGYGYAQDMVRLDMTGREAGEIVAALREALVK